MSKDLTISKFNFDTHPITTLVDDGSIWFIAKEISKILGYSQTNAMTKRLDDDEMKMTVIQNEGNYYNQTLINESGLYNSILGSKLPSAKAFKKWVTKEVLPKIRETGGYQHQHIPTKLSEALRLAADQAELIEQQTLAIEQLAPKGEFVDNFVDATGLIGFRKVVKLIRSHSDLCNEGVFREFLVQSKIQYLSGGEYLAYAQYIDQGWFKVKTGVKGLREYIQTSFTPKGLTKITELWKGQSSSDIAKLQKRVDDKRKFGK